jgi:glutamate-1-semialdehyde 2,1-aminomutase
MDDEVFVDFLGEFTAGIYGHSNPAIAAAVSEAMKKGWNYGGPNTYERELAKKVCCMSRALEDLCRPSLI